MGFSFNGSAGTVSGTNIIASGYGGTGNGFTKFTGPTTSEKTFTLPDANATLARTDAGQTFTGTQTFSGLIVANFGSNRRSQSEFNYDLGDGTINSRLLQFSHWFRLSLNGDQHQCFCHRRQC